MLTNLSWLIVPATIAYNAWVVHHMMATNRTVETPRNQTTPAPTDQEIAWHVVHIRDDVGSLCGLLGVANLLLAAILAVLITHFW
jgi:hypothetical protein